ncbi:MAG: glycosyltransferase family 9 protein [Candidatus Ratteibacteria bacterium]|jgi:ADP-heptose:LPS heptosyltransferase
MFCFASHRNKPKKILIIGGRKLNENLLMSPAVTMIRNHFSEAEIFLAAGEEAKDYLLHSQRLAGVHLIPENASLFSIIALLRKERYDLGIDLTNGFIPYALRIKKRLFFFSHTILSDKCYTHESDRFIGIVSSLLKTPVPKTTSLFFPSFSAEKEKVTEELKKKGITSSTPIVVIAPGTEEKKYQWPTEKYAHIANTLAEEYETKIIFLGIEKKAVEEISSFISKKESILPYAPVRSIHETAAILSRSTLVISEHNTIMYLASALAIPTVAIFGPTNPYRFGPIGTEHSIIHAELSCFPCKNPKKCRLSLQCLTQLSPEKVLSACRLILDKKEQLYLFDL